jgi:alpha-tubulin suppressor-like RCC1 family protein
MCWGHNRSGQCTVPASLDGIRVIAVSCGHDQTAVVTEAGVVACWGENRNGQCNVPRNLNNAVYLSCGGGYTAALTTEGRIVCWGWNRQGRCDVPTGLESFNGVSCGRSYSCCMLGWKTDHLGLQCLRSVYYARRAARNAAFNIDVMVAW